MVTRKNQRKAIGLALLMSLFLMACGGGSGGGSGSNSVGGGSGGDSGSDNGQKVSTTSLYSQPKQLGVGDALYVDLNSATSLDFDGVASGAEFLLAVMNTSASSGSFAVTMSGDLSAEFDVVKELGAEDLEEEESEELLPNVNDVTENFHDFLRSEEQNSENWEAPVDSFSAGKSAGGSEAIAAVSLGDSRTFKTLSNLNSSTAYVEVTATAECIGSNVLFYVDSEVTQTMLSDADIQTLCDYFDPIVAREQNLFGSLSDVDGNGKVLVLFTPRVNRLGAQGGGIITGYFIANDLYPSSGSNPASNYAEILYIMAPDPSGQFGAAISRSFAMSNLLPSVLPHELQHAINYNEHVFLSGGRSENSCLNEGLSHMAEDLMGQGQENPSRYGIYLSSPQSYSVVSCSSAGLGNRGGTYLFLRFLYEQAGNGDAFLKRLIQTSHTGVENVEKAFAGSEAAFDQFGEFFLRWSIALTGITQDARFSYKARERDASTGQWKGACVKCRAEDNRGTVLRGALASIYRGLVNNSVRPAAARFFKIASIRDRISFGNNSGGEGYGMLIRSK